jgi:hypothetical protein
MKSSRSRSRSRENSELKINNEELAYRLDTLDTLALYTANAYWLLISGFNKHLSLGTLALD